MKCPVCPCDRITSWIVWMGVPYWHIHCPDCEVEIKLEKNGTAQYSTYMLALPAGIMIILGVFGIYWNTTVFLLICIFSLALDYFIDMKYIQLLAKNQKK